MDCTCTFPLHLGDADPCCINHLVDMERSSADSDDYRNNVAVVLSGVVVTANCHRYLNSSRALSS